MIHDGIRFRTTRTTKFRFTSDGRVEFIDRKTGMTIPVDLAGSNYGYVSEGPQTGRVYLVRDGQTYTAPAKAGSR